MTSEEVLKAWKNFREVLPQEFEPYGMIVHPETMENIKAEGIEVARMFKIFEIDMCPKDKVYLVSEEMAKTIVAGSEMYKKSIEAMEKELRGKS